MSQLNKEPRVFSDYELKQMEDNELINPPQVNALIARLEAAELCVNGHISLEMERINYDDMVSRLKAWRKAAGKE